MESLRVPVKSRGRCVRRDFSVVREKRSLRDAQTRFSESVKGEWLCFGFWFCTQVWCTPRVFKSGERALFRCQLLDFPGLQSQIPLLSKEKEKKRKKCKPLDIAFSSLEPGWRGRWLGHEMAGSKGAALPPQRWHLHENYVHERLSFIAEALTGPPSLEFG